MKSMIVAAALILSFSLNAKADVINDVTYNVIVKTYKGLQAASEGLKANVAALETNPTQENLEAAQASWRQMRLEWEATEGFLFGPVSDLQIDPQLDSWPLNRSQLQEVLTGGNAITKEFVESNAGEIGGFHTAEFLLFGDGLHSNTQPVSNLTPRAITYLRLVVDVMVDHIATLTSSWETAWTADPNQNPSNFPYARILAEPGLTDIYSEPVDVYAQLVDGMKNIVNEVASTKIANSFGADLGSVDLEKEESPYSWNSLADFTDNVRSVWNVYTGEYRGVDQGLGLEDYLVTKDAALAAEVRAKILDTIDRIQAIAGPGGMTFRAAITSGADRPRVQHAIDGLNELYEMLDLRVLPTIVR